MLENEILSKEIKIKYLCKLMQKKKNFLMSYFNSIYLFEIFFHFLQIYAQEWDSWIIW